MGLYFKKIGAYNIAFVPQVENVNPIELEFENRLDSTLSFLQTLIDIDSELSKAPKEMANRVAHRLGVKNHLKEWELEYNEIMSIPFPEGYFRFLESTKRKEQNRILEKFELDSLTMQAIFFRAYDAFDFKYSFYKFEKKPNGFQHRRFPELYYKQPNNTLDIIGETDLKEGELRNVLDQRNAVIAKFLDKGHVWHCFLHTYNGIQGKEIKNTPHIHYISSAFSPNLTRQKVLEQVSTGKYHLPNMIHIPFSKKDIMDYPNA